MESTFADHAAELIGDDQTYQRILQLKRKRKNPEAAVPPELEIMQTWDPISKSKIPEAFIHHKTFDFFYLKEFIHLLSGNISIDGTFEPVKNIPGTTQLFCINAQLYDHIHSCKTHVQPILIAAYWTN